ncbi:unnamed protein product [Brassica napus]|uniref:(rape) hypothetical protein n=1 Tax=Brassica napus TaxID=3708 RepID=A0A816WFA5_BRANA|nr:unnamed protein product [Brassica napus]
MAGGGDAALQRRTGVWWDLNTCPVPDGFDPRRVRGCIESAVHKQMGHRSKVIIYAMGNLEYISSALLEEIASSGIVLIHAPCGGNDFKNLLREWSQLNPSSPATTVMLISRNYTMMMTVNEDEPLCICDICYDTFEICAEFITHLKSEEHIKELSGIVPRDSWYCKPMHFCHVCNYPGYDEYNMLLHNQSEDHCRKLDESRKRLISLPRETSLTSYVLNESNKTFLSRKKRKDKLY